MIADLACAVLGGHARCPSWVYAGRVVVNGAVGGVRDLPREHAVDYALGLFVEVAGFVESRLSATVPHTELICLFGDCRRVSSVFARTGPVANDMRDRLHPFCAFAARLPKNGADENVTLIVRQISHFPVPTLVVHSAHAHNFTVDFCRHIAARPCSNRQARAGKPVVQRFRRDMPRRDRDGCRMSAWRSGSIPCLVRARGCVLRLARILVGSGFPERQRSPVCSALAERRGSRYCRTRRLQGGIEKCPPRKPGEAQRRLARLLAEIDSSPALTLH